MPARALRLVENQPTPRSVDAQRQDEIPIYCSCRANCREVLAFQVGTKIRIRDRRHGHDHEVMIEIGRSAEERIAEEIGGW